MLLWRHSEKAVHVPVNSASTYEEVTQQFQDDSTYATRLQILRQESQVYYLG